MTRRNTTAVAGHLIISKGCYILAVYTRCIVTPMILLCHWYVVRFIAFLVFDMSDAYKMRNNYHIPRFNCFCIRNFKEWSYRRCARTECDNFSLKNIVVRKKLSSE